MSTSALWHWDGEAMRPADLERAKRTYRVGRRYRLLDDERSKESHDHFFAVVRYAFANLREGHPFKDEDHLRKWALIRRGYYTTTPILLPSAAEAERYADIARMIAEEDEHIEVVVDGPLVTIVRPDSQALAAMGGKRFNEVKQAVVQHLAHMLDVDAEDLVRISREAA